VEATDSSRARNKEAAVGQIMKRWGNLHYRRPLGAAALGFTVACLPLILRYLPETGIFASIILGIELLGAPGVMVNMVTSGNVHSGSLWVIYAANVIFYSWLFYVLLGVWLKQRAKS
jgi:hypothetical protein